MVHYFYEHNVFNLEELEPQLKENNEHILERDPFQPFEKAKGPYYTFY